MPVPTDIKFKDFLKAVEKIADKKHNGCDIVNRRGSAVAIILLDSKGEYKDSRTVHEDTHERKIYTQDLKKVCTMLGVKTNDFKMFVKSKFKRFPK